MPPTAPPPHDDGPDNRTDWRGGGTDLLAFHAFEDKANTWKGTIHNPGNTVYIPACLL